MYEKKDIPSMNPEFYEKKPAIAVVTLDGDELEQKNARQLTKLAALRGLKDVKVIWDAEKQQYIANGVLCGRSVDGVACPFQREVVSSVHGPVADTRQCVATRRFSPRHSSRSLALTSLPFLNTGSTNDTRDTGTAPACSAPRRFAITRRPSSVIASK